MRSASRLLIVALLLPCAAASAQAPFDASAWRSLLERYATEDGGFRYAALHASATDRAVLDRLTRSIGDADVSSGSREAQLGFYLDAYNALVVKAVVDRWPVRSVIRVPGFFDEQQHRVAGRELTLVELENDVIRGARFSDPRIHFALNCASASCPPLSRRPYSGDPDLDARLDAQTRAFVRRTTRLDRAARTVRLSQIFEWYAADFARGGIRNFVAYYLDPSDASFVRDSTTRVTHTPYDWAINARP